MQFVTIVDTIIDSEIESPWIIAVKIETQIRLFYLQTHILLPLGLRPLDL